MFIGIKIFKKFVPPKGPPLNRGPHAMALLAY